MAKEKIPIREFRLDAIVYRLSDTLSAEQLQDLFVKFVEKNKAYCAVSVKDITSAKDKKILNARKKNNK